MYLDCPTEMKVGMRGFRLEQRPNLRLHCQRRQRVNGMNYNMHGGNDILYLHVVTAVFSLISSLGECRTRSSFRGGLRQSQVPLSTTISSQITDMRESILWLSRSIYRLWLGLQLGIFAARPRTIPSSCC